MISSTTDIKTVIEYLQWIQDNIEELQAIPDGYSGSVDVYLTSGWWEFRADFGLCDNVLCDHLESHEIGILFNAWPECSDNPVYPCDDREDFVNDVNLYLNPKRLRLIKHCIKYLQDELEKRDAQED